MAVGSSRTPRKTLINDQRILVERGTTKSQFSPKSQLCPDPDISDDYNDTGLVKQGPEHQGLSSPGKDEFSLGESPEEV